MTYEIRITPTGKSFSPRDSWVHLSERDEVIEVETRAEVREFLRERFGKCKRVPMYQDRKNGPPVKVGYVFGYRNADWSHAPVQHWLQRDWVSISEITRTPAGEPKGGDK